MWDNNGVPPKWKSTPVPWNQTKTPGILRVLWTCCTPMQFSVHIIAYILQKQLLRPQANSLFSACGNKGSSVNPARSEILQRQETKQELVLCLQQSFPSTWLQFSRCSTGTFSSSILRPQSPQQRPVSQVKAATFPRVCDLPSRPGTEERSFQTRTVHATSRK